jgi:hypothetical protein
MDTHHSKAPAKRSFPSVPTRRQLPELTRGAMVTDICLVAAWGAMIPGLMWLGAAGGF